MSEANISTNVESDITTELKQRTERLEQEIADARRRHVEAELRTEAVKAGMIDVDGLKLLDASSLTFGDDGAIIGASQLMETFKKAKPWLFTPSSSSNSVLPPAARQPRAKLAMEMTDSEYKSARAAILRLRD